MHLRDGIQTHTTVVQRYARLVDQGAISDDPAQRRIVSALDRVNDGIRTKRVAHKSSALGWLFARSHDPQKPAKGLYIHGGVGRGKTMLMDLFFEVVSEPRKRRVHFNAFMADVHDRIQAHRQARKDGVTDEDDPIPPVAKSLAKEAWVLCFDEFSVTDIADAMVLSRLFSAMFDNGVVLVATSNFAPDDLYRDGLNRPLFEPFIAMLKRHCEVAALASDTDYRQAKLKGLPAYISPLSDETDRRMDEIWKTVTASRPVQPIEIAVMGRAVKVPLAEGLSARFTFADLCQRPLGARDYLAIADRFSTLLIDRVPVLAEGMRNEAKRFILLIDTLYDRQIRIFVSADASPDTIYEGRSGNEMFEFQRTASRLIEMQGKAWLDAWDQKHP